MGRTTRHLRRGPGRRATGRREPWLVDLGDALSAAPDDGCLPLAVQAATLRRALDRGGRDMETLLTLDRMLLADAGALVTSVVEVVQGPAGQRIVLDGNLPRPLR